MVTQGTVVTAQPTGTAPRILVTGDELTAVARCLGAPRWPGVLVTSYDRTPRERHADLDAHAFGALVDRGLLVADDEGLRPSEALETIVTAALRSRVFVSVEQVRPATDPNTVRTFVVLAGEHGVVRHGRGAFWHCLDLDAGAHDLHQRVTTLLGELVDRSPGPGQPRRRRYRGRRSGLAELVPAPSGGWQRITILARTDDAGDDAYVAGFLAVFDGGPGQLWLVTEDDGDGDPGDHMVVAQPASATEVDAAISAFAALDGGVAPPGKGFPYRVPSRRSYAALDNARTERTASPWRS